MKHSHLKLIIWCVVLLLILAGLGFVAKISQESTQPNAEQSTLEERSIPVFSEEIRAKLAQSEGFDVLVSYTDRGFEPNMIKIAQGKRVRFSNNAQGSLQVGQTSGARYGEGVCDTDSLQACAPSASRDFWEFTFDKPGLWTIVNVLNEAHQAVVRVE